ncbi:MAG: DEAD/DEAH box helicase [Nanoarchaeota archaeon]
MSRQYKEFTLDPFQEDAIDAIDRGNSVVVSAATGTGKTLIADYIVNEAVQKGWKVIYTAPIKALSNQKFKDFKEEYGDQIGMMTGDVVINAEAPILIMTTEIYRNMLLDNEQLEGLRYVIFDEIHYLNDPERGTVWEESIIFSSPDVRFLCLSATIPNHRQFADWIESIQGHTVETVHYGKRAVPLSHHLYDAYLGMTDFDKLEKSLDLMDIPQYERHRRKGRRGPPKLRIKTPDHRDLIRELRANDWLPCIFFVFSRVGTLERAKECARKFDLTSKSEKSRIINYFNEAINPQIRSMQSTQQLKRLLIRGVGVHNAGMLPNLKDIVEHLFAEGLLRVLYATETFAVGINMPARTVCFASLEKYDGQSFRYLHSKEYFQLAGRAGRRGIDTVGRAISMITRIKLDIKAVKKLMDKDIEPMESQFKLSYNTVLNLMKNYDEDSRHAVLESNFGYFVRKQSEQQARIMTSFANYRRRLEKLDFLQGDQLTWKGEFATHIYAHEIGLSQFVFKHMWNNMTDEQLALVLTAMMYDPRPSDHFRTKGAQVGRIINMLSADRDVKRSVNFKAVTRLYHLVRIWYGQGSFHELLEVCSLAEGDIIRLFRQVLDIISQVKHALLSIEHFPDLVEKLDRIESAIDRDLVAVDFA